MADVPTVRTATDADLDAIRGLDSECFPPGDLDREPAGEGELERGIKYGEILVVDEGGDVVAFLHYEQSSLASVYLRALAVRKDRRGRGVNGERSLAGRLLDQYLALPVCHEPTVAITATSSNNFAMIRLLVSRGFYGRAVLPDLFGPQKDRILFRRATRLNPAESTAIPLAQADLLQSRLDDVAPNGTLTFQTRVLSSVLMADGKPRAYGMGQVDTDELPPGGQHNGEFPWDEFDPEDYLAHNYAAVHPCDAPIIDLVADFFGASVLTSDRSALDLGTGSNLYPPLLMLPFCRDITLWEYSPRNSQWLREQCAGYGVAWDQFWERMVTETAYRQCADPRSLLADKARIKSLSVFELPPRVWDLGTMFFVAESISPSERDFQDVISQFLSALKIGSAFAMAFMERSTGYSVDGKDWPSYNVGMAEIEDYLLPRVESGLRVEFIPSDPTLREGYGGMVVAMGCTASVRSPLPSSELAGSDG
jgi:hypothetical protein